METSKKRIKQRILVSGGLGFIGSRIVAKLLSRGNQLTVLDNLSAQIHGDLPAAEFGWAGNSNCQVVRADIRNLRALDEALEGVDTIAHLAAETGTGQSMYEIARYSGVNTYGTAVLLDRVVNRKLPIQKIVLASSRSIYGEGSYICSACRFTVPMTPDARRAVDMAMGIWEPPCRTCGTALSAVATKETAPMRPASIYAATKAAQEDLVRVASSAAGIPAIALRLQNVYGEGQSLKNPYTGIISIFSTRIRQRLSVPLYEDGEESRDFVHVDDVVEAFTAAIDAELDGFVALNIGTGTPTSVRVLAETLIDALGGTQPPVVTGEYRLGDIRHCFADIALSERLIGFKPKIGISEGLQRFANWAVLQPLPEDRLARVAAELTAHGMMNRATP